MERLSEIGPINDLFGWLESFTVELTAGAYRDGRERPPVWDKISALVEEYESGQTSYDSLYCFIAASSALHAAAEAVRAAGDEEWSHDLHSMGQMFARYAVSDVDKMLAEIARTAVVKGAVVDGGKTVH